MATTVAPTIPVGCSQQSTNENNRYAQSSWNRSKQLSHGDQQVFSDFLTAAA